MKPQRIIHVCQPTAGGAATVVRELARAGVEAGQDVTVVCPADGPLAGWVVEAGARWHDLAMSRSPGPADLLLALRLRRIAADADVLHLHSSKAGAAGRLAVRTLRDGRPRVIFSPHGWSWYVGGRLAPVYRIIERWAARTTDVIVTVSAAEERDGRRVLGPAAPLHTIPNGVDTTSFTRHGETASRRSAGLVVVIGRLSTAKGQDRAIEMLALIDPALDVHLRLVGDGPDEPALRELSAALGVADRVEFVGSADPRPHLRAADVVLMPSRWEGMSLAMLEAMSSECVVVATRCGGTGILEDAGYLVDNSGDVAVEMRDAVVAALAPTDRNVRLRLKARAAVVAAHSLSAMTGQYQAIWAPASVDDRLASEPRTVR